MSSLDKRIAYLGLADFDYLSARVLLRHGLAFNGLPRATETFEKVLKLNLMLEAKISRNEEIPPEALKPFGHDLVKLLAELKRRITITTPPELEEYFAMLTDAYSRRYPEHWKAFRVTSDIGYLDHIYAQFRNLAAQNFPIEERERARCFGTFIGDAYTPAMIEQIKALGGQSPWDLLAHQNEALTLFDLELDVARRTPAFP